MQAHAPLSRISRCRTRRAHDRLRGTCTAKCSSTKCPGSSSSSSSDPAGSGPSIASRVFQALQGSWQLQRQVSSRRAALPSGCVTGSASFSATGAHQELLYREQGRFESAAGHSLSVSRQYMYSYCPSSDTISVYFVTGSSPPRRDYLFHSLSFFEPTGGGTPQPHGAVAPPASEAGHPADEAVHLARGGEHPCRQDVHSSSYEFAFVGPALTRMEIVYVVQGPETDYTSSALYCRTLP